jgi:hypothetical protein
VNDKVLTTAPVYQRVLQVAMSEHAENGAKLGNSSLTRSGLEIQPGLLRRQFVQQGALGGWCVEHGVRSQQHHGVGQQRHAPREPQAVEKHLPQSQLVFLVRLGGLDPRTDLLQQTLGGSRVEGQQSQQYFVNAGRVGELARTVAGLPTDRTQRGRGGRRQTSAGLATPRSRAIPAVGLADTLLRFRSRRARPVSCPNADASRRPRASVAGTTVCFRRPDNPCRPRLDAATTTSADRSSGGWG